MYFENLFKSIEQLFKSKLRDVPMNLDKVGNALCAGDYRATVSGRVGHHALKMKMYWVVLEWVIDKTFEPIDGINHCYRAYVYEEARYASHRRGNDIALAVLGLGVFVVCAFLAPFILAYSWLR